MNKLKFTHKVTILFFSLFCLLIQTNTIHAQGANAPEAASFEPVDATDMVNLVTGDLSYVLPLLNVPSPEGGYPIALSYHGGIAMDQEASWVGLGWTVNPGAINRGVNGYPDDWGKTTINEFFYDKGWEEDFYSFGVGYSIESGLSVGVGLSWGSNQSVGGFISASIGPKGGPGIGGSIGINGSGSMTASINGRSGAGFSASLGTSGIGIGYGSSAGGNTTVGLSLNYNYSSGLSGGVSVGEKGKSFGKNTAVGINFSSNGVSLNAKVNGVGAGISTSTNSINAGDYDVSVSTLGFFIPVYAFNISYSHTNVKYSLYKYNNLYTSGMLYTVNANELQPYDDGSGLSRRLKENNFMDVNVIQEFGSDDLYSDLIEDRNKNNKNNLILPNYDNYNVNAQGLSGVLNPYIHSQLNLSARGRGEQNQDNEYVQYLNHDILEYKSAPSSGIDVNRDGIAKKYFTFIGGYNSFLRLETSNISQNPNSLIAHSDNIMNDYNTSLTNNFYNDVSLVNNRKREGNSIETYTNKEIRENPLVGFIEAKEGEGLLNRQDVTVFLNEGIGAFKITSLDGKTYHYSLPVYQFESFYKTYVIEDSGGKRESFNTTFRSITSIENLEEDYNFFEIQKTTPYATHWLLTAITGPDYVDNNSNGKVDEQDYGYWVEFDYGKWSDGYVWQTPNGRHEEIENKNKPEDNAYAYSWGRKQVYYLDAIKTRTHTALFVKDLREDNESLELNRNSEVWNPSNPFYVANYKTYNNTKYSSLSSGNILFDSDGNENNIPNEISIINEYTQDEFNAKVTSVKAIRSSLVFQKIPKEKSLYLKKIILLENSKAILNKKSGTLTDKISGYHSSNMKITNLRATVVGGWDNNYGQGLYLYENPINVKQYNKQIHENVLDISDIASLNLENYASQLIEFNHNYSLAKNAPNTEISFGRLTLEKVSFKGKGGIQLIPPYKFKYLNETTNYNKDDIDDWGYHKTTPQVWSLSEITTPTGGKIAIQYESDKYESEASRGGIEYDIHHPKIEDINKLGTTHRLVNFNYMLTDARKYFKVGLTYELEFGISDYNYGVTNLVRKTSTKALVNEVGEKYVVFKNSNFVLLDRFNPIIPSGSPNGEYVNSLTIIGSRNDISLFGGGIRTKNIAISDGIHNIATTEYEYSNGITSYVPSKEQKGIPYVSELPAPMVMYGEVKMLTKDRTGKELGSTVYEFETLEPRKEEAGYIFSLGEAFRVRENQNDSFEDGKVIANKYTIESKLGNLGRLKYVTSYNNKNQVLHKKENYYKQNLNANGEIGVTQESHSSYKRVFKNDLETFYVSSTSKVNYPSVLESTKVTQGGFSIEKHFDTYDFLTGQLLETRTYASDGTAFKNKSVPAYTKYPEMGSKVDDINNKNMLSQQAASFTYLLDENENIDKVIGAGITTWNNEWTYRDEIGLETTPTNDAEKIWRKHKSYVWNGPIDSDGGYAGFDINNHDDRFWGDDNIPDPKSGISYKPPLFKWKQVSETTRYDHFSAPLETMDVNYNYAATKMCDNESKVLAVANTKYTEMYYSGAEYLSSNSNYFDGEVKSLGQSSIKAHTGIKSIAIASGQNGFEVNLNEGEYRDGKYKFSVWVDKGNESIAQLVVGTTTHSFIDDGFEQIPAGDWVLLNKIIDIPAGGTTVYVTSVSGTIYFDDFRLVPIASSITSYIYNEWDELWYIIGNNGLATRFEYDAAGRLIKTFTEVIDNDSIIGGFKKVGQNQYNYKYNQQ